MLTTHRAPAERPVDLKARTLQVAADTTKREPLAAESVVLSCRAISRLHHVLQRVGCSYRRVVDKFLQAKEKLAIKSNTAN